MGSVSVTKVILLILNLASFILGLAIAITSIWFYIQIHEIISLRNKNHYLLDYNVYWPQVVPWIFFICALFILSVSCCGVIGLNKDSRILFILYGIFLAVVIICFIIAATLALVLADETSTEKFVKDIVWDGYSQMKSDDEIAEAFKHIERKLHCCGVHSPRDYKNWRNEFPMSCCDGYNYGWLEPFTVDCGFSNKLANERHGCAAVATQYAVIITKVLSGASIFTAVIAVMSLLAAVLHYPEL